MAIKMYGAYWCGDCKRAKQFFGEHRGGFYDRGLPYSSNPDETLPTTADLAATVARVAWLSVVLGLLFEALSLAAALAFATTPLARSIVAEVAQKVSWSVIVCVGLALGTAATKLRAPALGADPPVPAIAGP